MHEELDLEALIEAFAFCRSINLSSRARSRARSIWFISASS